MTKKRTLTNPIIYSVICEAVQGISGHEQESICVRWCDETLTLKKVLLVSGKLAKLVV